MSQIERLKRQKQELEQKLEFAVRNNEQLRNLFAAVLMQHHCGKCELSPVQIEATKGWVIHAQAFAHLGFLQVSAMTVEEMQKMAKHQAPSTSLTQVAQSAQRPEEPEKEAPLSCANPWHVDADALGARCSECGSRQKLATCEAATA